MAVDLRPLCPTRCGARPAPGMPFCHRCWRFMSRSAQALLIRSRREWFRGRISNDVYEEAIAYAVHSILYGKRYQSRRPDPRLTRLAGPGPR